MNAQVKTKFAEFISMDANRNITMRLGPTVYVQNGADIFWQTKSGELVLVTDETHATKPWIRENFKRERAFQKRKALAIGLQSSHIPSQDRRAFNKRMGRVWA